MLFTEENGGQCAPRDTLGHFSPREKDRIRAGVVLRCFALTSTLSRRGEGEKRRALFVQPDQYKCKVVRAQRNPTNKATCWMHVRTIFPSQNRKRFLKSNEV